MSVSQDRDVVGNLARLDIWKVGDKVCCQHSSRQRTVCVPIDELQDADSHWVRQSLISS
jgi:hypothetical protein